MSQQMSDSAVRIRRIVADKLRRIALDMEFKAKGRASLVGLFSAIAEKEVCLITEENLNSTLEELVKRNNYAIAEKLAEYANIELDEPKIIKDIKDKIINKQPFRLSYVDAVGKAFIFDCDYGEISNYEDKQYLEVRYVNSISSNSPPPLDKNRCLRLDRIPADTRLEDLNLQWGELEKIEVQFKLTSNLAHSYHKDSSDKVEAMEEGLIVRRSISNDFFFRRKIIRYGSSCEVISPEIIRKNVIANLEDSLAVYRTSRELLDSHASLDQKN